MVSSSNNANDSTGDGGVSTSTNYYEDALEDVHTRFILNLPDSELSTADRIFFQLEQAWWYYEDWIGDIHPEYNLPRYTSFKPFAKMMYEYSPLLPTKQFLTMWNEYSAYRRSISNYGCILVTEDYQQMILCQVYNSNKLMFPSGKINHGEDGPTAAARETYEETGFDPLCQRGLTSIWKEQDPTKISWSLLSLQDENMLIHQEDASNNNYHQAKSSETNTNATPATPGTGGKNQSQQNSAAGGGGKRRIFYVVVGVPKDFPFEPVCRKEVSNIIWYPIHGSLPKPSFGVIPFIPQLKKYIYKQQQQHNQSIATTSAARDRSSAKSKQRNNDTKTNISATKAAAGTGSNTPKKSRSRNSSSGRNNSRGRNANNSSNGRSAMKIIDTADNDLVKAGLAVQGDTAGWSEEDMFLVNEKLIGKKCDYDGNPYIFSEQGFSDGIDPHAFRIVGGTFLNQQPNQPPVSTSAAPTTEDANGNVIQHFETNPRNVSRLQQLFNNASSTTTAAVTTSTVGVETINTTTGIISGNNSNGDENDDEISLKPFFSTDGSTPWGEIVEEIVHLEPKSQEFALLSFAASDNSDSNARTNSRAKEKSKNLKAKKQDMSKTIPAVNSSTNQQQQQFDNDSSVWEKDGIGFLTDVEITRRNQEKLSNNVSGNSDTKEYTNATLPRIDNTRTPTAISITEDNNNRIIIMEQQRRLRQQRIDQYNTDMEFIQQWVNNLPKSSVTKRFGLFQLDADAIMKSIS